MKFSGEDVKYLATHKLALRHVLGDDNLARHYQPGHMGDAHCIGAAHLLLTKEEKAGSKEPANGFLDMVFKYADVLAERLDKKLDDIIISSSGIYEDKIQPQNYFLLMRGMDGADRPYDLHAYPMGKAGRQDLHESQIVAKVDVNTRFGLSGIADDIKAVIRETNAEGILANLYPEAQSLIDGRVPKEYVAQDVARFSRNLDVLCRADPASAYSYAAALLTSPEAKVLHETAGKAVVGALALLAKEDPGKAKIYADVAAELGGRGPLQGNLANLTKPFSSSPATPAANGGGPKSKPSQYMKM